MDMVHKNISIAVYMYTCTDMFIVHCNIVGLNICEVAHDHQASVTNFIIQELHFLNSYDTWHGKFNVTFCVLFVSIAKLSQVPKILQQS